MCQSSTPLYIALQLPHEVTRPVAVPGLSVFANEEIGLPEEGRGGLPEYSDMCDVVAFYANFEIV